MSDVITFEAGRAAWNEVAMRILEVQRANGLEFFWFKRIRGSLFAFLGCRAMRTTCEYNWVASML